MILNKRSVAATAAVDVDVDDAAAADDDDDEEEEDDDDEGDEGDEEVSYQTLNVVWHLWLLSFLPILALRINALIILTRLSLCDVRAWGDIFDGRMGLDVQIHPRCHCCMGGDPNTSK